MKTYSRRAVLALGLIGGQSLLAACGGGGGGGAAGSGIETSPPVTAGGSPVQPSAPTPSWSVPPTIGLVADGQYSFDLSITLPSGVKLGGTFSVDPSGAALPTGVTLSSKGILSASSGAALDAVSGIVFAYSEA
jgi:hypothetical protein